MGQCGIEDRADLWENLRICDYKSFVRKVLHSTRCHLNTGKSGLPLKGGYKNKAEIKMKRFVFSEPRKCIPNQEIWKPR